MLCLPKFVCKGRDSEIAPTEDGSVFVGGNSDSRLLLVLCLHSNCRSGRACETRHAARYQVRKVGFRSALPIGVNLRKELVCSRVNCASFLLI